MHVKKGSIEPTVLLELFDSGQAGISFSQAFEDCFLWKVFRRKRGGFYVDVGAHDPIRFSNTYLLHRFRGWHGVNIDADPQAIHRFSIARPNDKNVLAAISDEPNKELTMTFYKDGAVNTLDDQMRDRRRRKKTSVVRESTVTTRTLSSILDECVPVGQGIDFFDVDIEGFDLKALRSNNWDRHRPEYIFVELHGFELHHMEKSPTLQYLRSVGYEIVSFLFVTAVFKRMS